MSIEHSAFVIPEGLTIELTDRGLVIENERDVIIRSKLNENICQIHSKHGNITVDIDIELNEIVAKNGCVHFTGNSKAKKIIAKEVKADQNLEADIIEVLNGDLNAKHDLKATDVHCKGHIDIGGNGDIRNIVAGGKVSLGGDLESAQIKAGQDISINGFVTAQNITSASGSVIVEKPIRAKSILAHGGVINLTRDASISLIRGESIRILGGKNDIKAMQAKTAIELAECDIRADVVMAPKINIHPNAEGKIMVAESEHPIGPHSVKGCLALEDLSGLIEDLDQFLIQRGLSRGELNWETVQIEADTPVSTPVADEPETLTDEETTPTVADNADSIPADAPSDTDELTATVVEVEEVADEINTEASSPDIQDADSDSESDSEDMYSDLDDSEEDSNTTATIQFDAVAELDEAIAELDEEDFDSNDDAEDNAVEKTETIQEALPKVSAKAAAIDLDEQPMDQLEINDEEEAFSDEVETDQEDSLYTALFDEVDCIVNSYEQEPDALTDLKDLVEKRNYQNLREEIKSIWSRLLKHHQRNNTRIPPKVTVAFNQINNHLRQ